MFILLLAIRFALATAHQVAATGGVWSVCRLSAVPAHPLGKKPSTAQHIVYIWFYAYINDDKEQNYVDRNRYRSDHRWR